MLIYQRARQKIKAGTVKFIYDIIRKFRWVESVLLVSCTGMFTYNHQASK